MDLNGVFVAYTAIKYIAINKNNLFFRQRIFETKCSLQNEVCQDKALQVGSLNA